MSTKKTLCCLVNSPRNKWTKRKPWNEKKKMERTKKEGEKLQKSDDSLHLSVSLSQSLCDHRLQLLIPEGISKLPTISTVRLHYNMTSLCIKSEVTIFLLLVICHFAL